MRFFNKLRLLLLLFFASLPLFFPKFILASEDFETSYQVRYQINTDGTARVSQDISLTNKLSNVYATQYTLNFQAIEITNIKANDELGPLEVETSHTGDATYITLKFNQEVVGTGKTLNFSLTYDALDLVTRTGRVWEITIPKLVNVDKIDNYQLQLAIPISFGEPAYISPSPISSSQENNYQVHNFTKNQIAQAGIKAAFGEFQVFDFILNYQLMNKGIRPTTMEIALPPDTAFQKVYYQSLEPKPNNVRVDEDGNWLASYSLSSNQRLNIETVGKVKVFSQPQKDFYQTDLTTLQKNLGDQEHWPVYNSLIQEAAQEFKTVEEVYNFVVDYLSYDFERVRQDVERQGALIALEKPEQAICMEFTDLFITLSRAIGVPAREINGYAYTTNPKLRPLSLLVDVLHSWPEYWNDEKKIWVPVDPTWEKTTGGVDYFNKTDLNHFAFAIHGVDSQLPVPAGSYRVEENGGKSIQVSFGKFEGIQDSKINVEFSAPKHVFAGLKYKGKVTIHNLGPTAVYNLPTQIVGENLSVSLVQNQEQIIIPPYGQRNLQVEFINEDWWEIGKGKVIIFLNNREYSQSIEIHSLVWQGILPLIGLLLLLGSAFFFLFKLTVRKRRVTKEL